MYRPALLLQILATLAACNHPNGPVVDGTQCVPADPDAACPAPEEVEDEILGDHCTAIVVAVTGEGVHGFMPAFAEGDSGDTEPTPACCYPTKERRETGCVDGRPLRIANVPVLAPIIGRADWGDAVGTVNPVLSEAWARAASYEHASVAAFARIVLELLAFGAPADLVREVQEAMGDEIRHATAMYGLAGGQVGPGPLPLTSLTLTTDLAAFAADCVREGCIGETVAAALMAASARGAKDARVRAILSGIAADESRHAALSWRLVHWAMEVGGDVVGDAVDAAFEAALIEVVVEAGAATDLSAFGRLGPAETARVTAASIRTVVRPARAVLRAA